jgi:hypothetical protein
LENRSQPKDYHPPEGQPAQDTLDAMKRGAQRFGEVQYYLSRTNGRTEKLRCNWKPNLSYGKYNEPVRGDEEFQWTWEYWSTDLAAAAPAHLRQQNRGWKGLPHQGVALRLLQGEPWADVEGRLLFDGMKLTGRFE